MQFITTGNRIMTENFSVGLFYTITFLNGNILACSCNGIGDNFVSFLCVEPAMQFILDLSTAETIDTLELYGGGAGTMNYNELENKPSINGEPLVGNLTTTDLHIRAVPIIDTTDNNKVLTASYVGGVTSYSWQTVPTGTTNYQDLTNKPEINGHVLSGNQLSSQLGLASAAQGSLADTAVQPADLASYQPLIDSSHKLDPALIETDTTHQFATQSQLDQITTNQNNILIVEQMAATKNKLDLAKAASVTVPDNVTYVTNSDKSITITVNGITSAKSLYFNDIPYIAGEIVLSGIPTGGGFSTYMADLQQNGTTIDNMSDQGDGSEPVTMANDVFTYRIRLAAGTYTFTVKPMIVSSTIWAAGFTDYTQYAPSNAELYAMIQALQS